MKILITTDTYSPMVNGVVTSIKNLYGELKQRGHDVRILTLSENYKEHIENDIYYLSALHTRVYPGAKIQSPISGRVIKDILFWQPDIIHSQTEFSVMLTAKLLSRILNIPIVHTYHTLYEDYLKYILGGKLITKRASIILTRFVLLSGLACIIIPTAKVETILLGYGIKKPLVIIPTGIDISRFQKTYSLKEKLAVRLALDIEQDTKLVVYIGRIGEEKNIQELFIYFGEFVKSAVNTKLMIVGGGPYLEVLKNIVQKLKLENEIIFTGMIEPQTVPLYYQLADVFVTSSTSETQGLTYIEAMASGVPVVCREDECVKGLVVTSETGYLYVDQDGFANGIKNVLALSPEEYASLQQRCREKARNYSIEIFGKSVETLYLSLVRERKPLSITRGVKSLRRRIKKVF
ncbi:MAG: glycosyltransferase [Clostridia bacterium]